MKTTIMTIFGILIFVSTAVGQSVSQSANQPDKVVLEKMEKTRSELVEKAVAYLRSAQLEDGSFAVSERSGIGTTGIVVAGLLQNGISPDDPMVARGLQFLLKHVQADGGIYAPPGRLKNYETNVMILALVHANRNGEYNDLLKNAERFVRDDQYDELNGYSPTDPYYGGVGYGNKTRPDLSNVQFLVTALHALGNGPDDPTIQKALVFVSRCQNFESEHNPFPLASKNPDGGFFYTGVNGGESFAGKTATGGLRSYGSMTYAGLKSMIYAGLTANDPRVKAAEGWIKENYTLDENPELGKRGLYYYYQTFANTMAALKTDVFTTQKGDKHFWKQEMLETLARGQQENGSWVNAELSWMEGDPNLVTGYVLMALADCTIK